MREAIAKARTQPVTIVTRTPVRMRKRNNPLRDRGVHKVARRLGFLGADYSSAINRQRDREQQPVAADDTIPIFRASTLWRGMGEHVPGSRTLIRHKRKPEAVYFAFMPRVKDGDPVVTEYRYEDSDGQPVKEHEIKPFEYAPAAQSSRQKTSKPIHWRTILISHLLSITMSGDMLLLERN